VPNERLPQSDFEEDNAEGINIMLHSKSFFGVDAPSRGVLVETFIEFDFTVLSGVGRRRTGPIETDEEGRAEDVRKLMPIGGIYIGHHEDIFGFNSLVNETAGMNVQNRGRETICKIESMIERMELEDRFVGQEIPERSCISQVGGKTVLQLEVWVRACKSWVDTFASENGHETRIGRFQHSCHAINIGFVLGDVSHCVLVVGAKLDKDMRERDGAKNIRILETVKIGRRTQIENDFDGRGL